MPQSRPTPWQYVRKFFPEYTTGRKPIDRRRIINAILYLKLGGDTTFQNNKATGTGGGAVYFVGSDNVIDRW